MKKDCVLYDRECINCGECDMCDLNPKKVCDNCGKCIESGDDYNIVDVDLTAENGDEPLNYHYEGEEEPEDDELFAEEDFEEDFAEGEAYDDAYDEEDDDDDDDSDLEFDFGEFFGHR